MIPVEPFDKSMAEPATSVWMTKEARSFTDKQKPDDLLEELLAKIFLMSAEGFDKFPGLWKLQKGTNGVYRIGIKRSLYRYYGVFRGNNRSHFIIVRGGKKRGQDRGAECDNLVKKTNELSNEEFKYTTEGV